MSTRELLAQIEHLMSRGDHRAAAIGCEEIGDLSRARALYEGLFDYKEAGRLAEMQGDAVGALDLYLKAGEVQLAEAVRRSLMADLSDDLPAALALFERRGFTLQAGELAESIGRTAQAAALYIKASSHKKAAALLERLGRLREAGEAYEQSLIGLPDDAEANLGLGRVLQRFGRHKEALRLLCRSAQDPAFVAESARRIACAFFKLGFLESGRTALELAGLPRGLDPDAFVRPFEDELQHELEANAHGASGPSASGALEGRYRMEKPLGGRVGATFLGRDLINDMPIVLRFFPGSAAENAEYYDELERLKNTRLSGHVRVLEINREGGFVVTEFVEGHSLLWELRSESPPNALRCRAYALQILDAVGAAHRVGVLHGALSPASIRIAPGGTCLVDDWGVRHIEKRMATQTGGEESTFAYRAPEMNIGRGADFRADLYAVAAILHRALVGKAPMMGRGAEGLAGWPAPFAEFFAMALDANALARHPSHDLFRRGLQALPWDQVASRALAAPAPSRPVEGEGRGPRFVCERAPVPGERVTARDTLLGRDVRLLKLPADRDLPAHLIDRLCALAGPEVPVFQDILRFDVGEGAIVLEVMKGEPVRSIVERQGAIDPLIALEAGEPLLAGLAAAHAEGVGLGHVNPDTIVFDGDGLRAPIEGALLDQAASQTQAIADDARGYWEALLLVTEGAPSARPGPRALVQALLRSGHLLPVDVQPLMDQIPASTGSLAAFPGWLDEVRRAVDACLVRRAVLDRLERVVASERGGDDLASEWLARRRRAFGVE